MTIFWGGHKSKRCSFFNAKSLIAVSNPWTRGSGVNLLFFLKKTFGMVDAMMFCNFGDEVGVKQMESTMVFVALYGVCLAVGLFTLLARS